MNPNALNTFALPCSGARVRRVSSRLMRCLALLVPPVMSGMLLGCVSVERSRSLSDSATPAKTIALQVCSNCHGVDGNSTSPNFPKLAGQQPAYFIAQLNGFKSHNRSDPAGFEYMWGLSKNLTQEQIEGLAAYYAEQRPRVSAVPARADVAAGKEIFENGAPSNKTPPCASCHGADGGGANTFPRIASQHGDYLIKQLHVFQRTDERPEGSIMKEVAHTLTEDQIVSVTNYLETMP